MLDLKQQTIKHKSKLNFDLPPIEIDGEDNGGGDGDEEYYAIHFSGKIIDDDPQDEFLLGLKYPSSQIEVSKDEFDFTLRDFLKISVAYSKNFLKSENKMNYAEDELNYLESIQGYSNPEDMPKDLQNILLSGEPLLFYSWMNRDHIDTDYCDNETYVDLNKTLDELLLPVKYKGSNLKEIELPNYRTMYLSVSDNIGENEREFIQYF